VTAVPQGNGEIVISWTNPSSDFDHARLYRSESKDELGAVKALEIYTNSISDSSGLSDQKLYYYTVRSVDRAGNESRNTDQVTVVAEGSSAVSLSGDDGTVDEVGFLPPELLPAALFIRNLTVGMRGSDVRTLQELLIKESVYPEAQVTGFFGQLTSAAVARFQEKYSTEILVPVGLSHGTGYFGPSTRDKANERVALSGITSGTESTPQNTGNVSFNRDLNVGSNNEDVRQLQIFLNRNGFTVAQVGVGSVGNETSYFGTLTKSAVIRFQERYASDILSPVGLTHGTGYFGPSTRSKANSL
jgi:peptidoglycan hydrolase-like protein with peptidoglycan-binding domain